MATEPNCTEQVYGNLLNAMRRAHNAGDMEKRERIYAAALVMEELWPEDCKRWSERFGS